MYINYNSNLKKEKATKSINHVRKIRAKLINIHNCNILTALKKARKRRYRQDYCSKKRCRHHMK